MKVRPKQIEVDAVQFTGENANEVFGEIMHRYDYVDVDCDDDSFLQVNINDHCITVNAGEWIVFNNKFHPTILTDAEFHEQFEVVQ